MNAYMSKLYYSHTFVNVATLGDAFSQRSAHVEDANGPTPLVAQVNTRFARESLGAKDRNRTLFSRKVEEA